MAVDLTLRKYMIKQIKMDEQMKMILTEPEICNNNLWNAILHYMSDEEPAEKFADIITKMVKDGFIQKEDRIQVSHNNEESKFCTVVEYESNKYCLHPDGYISL